MHVVYYFIKIYFKFDATLSQYMLIYRIVSFWFFGTDNKGIPLFNTIFHLRP